MDKFLNLKNYLSELNEQGICLAFSGGIDSALLLFLCKDAEAVTFRSVFQTEEEIEFCREFCAKLGRVHKIIDFYPLEDQYLINNPKDRCYHCKKRMFQALKDYAGNRVLLDGTNFDDLKVYRPGLKALKELGIISPFAKFEITKQEIREYAKQCGLEIYDKPSTPCLATRFPYGERLTYERIKMAETGERILKNYGFKNCRLRFHGDIARIEVTDFAKFLELKNSIVKDLKNLGFRYITLDLEGLRSGSMDIN